MTWKSSKQLKNRRQFEITFIQEFTGRKYKRNGFVQCFLPPLLTTTTTTTTTIPTNFLFRLVGSLFIFGLFLFRVGKRQKQTNAAGPSSLSPFFFFSQGKKRRKNTSENLVSVDAFSDWSSGWWHCSLEFLPFLLQNFKDEHIGHVTDSTWTWIRHTHTYGILQYIIRSLSVCPQWGRVPRRPQWKNSIMNSTVCPLCSRRKKKTESFANTIGNWKRNNGLAIQMCINKMAAFFAQLAFMLVLSSTKRGINMLYH